MEIDFDCPSQERSNNNRPSRKGDQVINFNGDALRPANLWVRISGRDRPAPESTLKTLRSWSADLASNYPVLTTYSVYLNSWLLIDGQWSH
jgi:hypothetical protein